MLQRYRVIFRVPGALAFCAASFITRMPIAIYPIAIVLVVSARDGRYGFAGVLSAVYVFGYAVGSLVLSALVDRRGQRRLLVPCAAMHAAGVLTFAILLPADAPDWLLVVPVAVFGFTNISVRALVRARWAYVLGAGPQLATALSLEGLLDEAVFMLGPLIATVLATGAAPLLVLYLSVALVVSGSLWLAGLRATEPRLHPREGARVGTALRGPGMGMLVLAATGMGAAWTSAEIATIAFCAHEGHRSLSGVVLAGASIGSGLAAVGYGAVDWGPDVLRRFRLHALVFAAAPAALLVATSVPMLTAALFVVGAGTVPLLITLFSLIPQLVPPLALTEGLSWANTGINIGAGAASALVGGIVDHHGARAGFFVAIAFAGCVAFFGGRVRAPSNCSRQSISDYDIMRPDPSPEVT